MALRLVLGDTMMIGEEDTRRGEQAVEVVALTTIAAVPLNLVTSVVDNRDQTVGDIALSSSYQAVAKVLQQQWALFQWWVRSVCASSTKVRPTFLP